jgi:hypothetical protein
MAMQVVGVRSLFFVNSKNKDLTPAPTLFYITKNQNS